jgi:hypothetical protein
MGYRRRPTQRAAGAGAVLGLFLAGCLGEGSFFRDPSGEPIEAVLRTAIPLAYAASAAMAAVNGAPPPNALATNTCSTFPCTSLVTVHVDARTAPPALAPFGTGRILVAGLWSSPESAILTVAFVDLLVGTSLLRVRDVSAFPAVVTPTGLEIVYASVDVNVAGGPVEPGDLTPAQIDLLFMRVGVVPSPDPAANVGLDAWVVEVDGAGTPQDLSDDRYSVTGGGEYVDATSGSGRILQLVMVGAVLAPGCTLNPVEGLAVLNEAGASASSLPVLGTALISFEPACTGRARVLVGTGSYLLCTGKTIPL